MVQQNYVGTPAQITFTMDSHELLTGDLRPAQLLRLRYDPLRIAQTDQPVVRGDPTQPVIAHARFHIDGPVTSAPLAATGMTETPIVDPTGRRGLMLHGEIFVPGDADLVSLWFTCMSTKGEQLTDDSGGLTYCFRFPSQDVAVRKASVTPQPGSDAAEFSLDVACVQPAERVSVRYHVLNHPDAPAGDIELQRSGKQDEEKREVWSGSISVAPANALIKYKIHYWLGGFRYKEDNSSSYFLASPQKPSKRAPRPPEALVEATKTWKW